MHSFKIKQINWNPAYRIVPSRFPSIYLFDRVASREDFDVLNELEAMTNPRLRDELGELSLVPDDEKIFGPGSGPIMASFTHLNPSGSRFSDGSYGVFYAAEDKRTAIEETKFHSANFLRATNEAPIHLQMRLYSVQVCGDVADLLQPDDLGILSPTSYAVSQAIGKQVRDAKLNGILYESVRNPGGACIAAFRTSILSKCFHAAYYEYHWDGKDINYVTQEIAS